MKATGQYFDEGESIVTFPDQNLLVERDGDIIRIETSSGLDDYYSLGEPGIVLELSLDDAIDLMARLSEVTMPENPMIVGEAIDGEALMRGECQTGDLCWFHAVEPGFFKVDPTPGHHDDLKDAMDCRKRAKNLQS